MYPESALDDLDTTIGKPFTSVEASTFSVKGDHIVDESTLLAECLTDIVYAHP